jgi:type I restriction enzyme S subunit
MMAYPQVLLSEVLTHRNGFIEIDDFETYKRCRVQSYGQGIVLRDIVPGASIKTKKQQVCQERELLVAEIDAKVGGFGIVPKDLDGAIVSSHYFLFSIDEERIDLRFLDYFLRTPQFQSQVTAQGTTNYAAIRPGDVLAYTIPLPPLEEQRRVVARIEELAGQLAEARELRRQAAAEAEAILGVEEMQIWSDASLQDAPTLEQVTTFLARGRQSKQGESDHYLIKTQHVQMGQYVKTNMTLVDYAAAKVSPDALVNNGDTLIACSAAGCLGRVAFYEDTDRVASTDTHVAIARPDTETILSEYLYAYLRSVQGQHQLRSRERGDWTREKVGFRLTELNLSDLKRVPVPLPPLSEQRRIVDYLDTIQAQVDTLKQEQAASSAELDALLPAVLDRAFKGEL